MTNRFLQQIIGSALGVFLIAAPLFAINVTEDDQSRKVQTSAAKSRYLDARGLYYRSFADFSLFRSVVHADPQKAGEAIAKGKDVLEKSNDVILSYLTFLKIHVQTQSQTNAGQGALITELDKELSWFTEKQDRVKVISTREELFDLAAIEREYWRKIQPRITRIRGLIIVAQYQYIREQFDSVEKNFSDQISETEQSNSPKFDQTLVQAFQSQRSGIEEYFTRAQATFEQLSDLDAETTFQNGLTALSDAEQALKSARDTLHRIQERQSQ